MQKELKTIKSLIPRTAVFKMAKNPVDFLIKHQKKTGSLYRIDAPVKFIIVSDPEYIKHMLQTNWRNYQKGAAYDGFKLFLGNGILASEGDLWRKNRKLIQPSFSKERIKSIANIVDETALKWSNKWLQQSKQKETIEVKYEMLEFTLEVISNAMMGKEETQLYKPLFIPLFQSEYDFVLKRNMSLFKMPLWVPIRSHIKFKKAKKVVDDILYSLIDSKEKHEDDTMLSEILRAKDVNGEGMSKPQLRDEFMTIFAAGFETTGTSLAWCFLLLAKHPEFQQKLYDEIKGINLGKSDAVFRSPWLNAFLSETLRLYPSAWIVSRKNVKEDVIDGQRIPKKSTIFVSIFGMHRDSRYWDRPEKFDPERFINAEQNPSYHPYGVGPRKCIGSYFSHTIMLYILYHMVSKFEISLADDRGFEMDAKISLKPKGDVNLSLKPRG